MTKFRLFGRLKAEIYRGGQLLQEVKFENGAVNVGIQLMLNAMFNSASASASWYLGLIDNSGSPVLDSEDTISTNDWDELVSYDEATRPAWDPGDATGSNTSVVNSSTVDFTINASVTAFGVFCINQNTKGGTTGTLWATAPFDSPVALVDDDVLKITYTVGLEDAS